ncbi:MAG: hypothetical protein KAS70_08085, partial [Planctomycetes bacterium]|nr:hypothetical protein [Planctomycetota bacterium]
MKRKFGKTRFLAYLKKLDQSINYKVILISMGGTALSLSDTKLYSDDIDLTYLAKKGRDFEKKARAVARRMAIPENGLHLFSKAETITLTNIPDYADRA